IEIRTDDKKTSSIVLTLNDDDTNSAVTAERSLLGKLHGGCQTPVGAIGEITSNSQLKLTALVSSLDGTNVIKDNMIGNIEDASDIGLELANRLLSNGADKILQEIRESLKNGI
ncbi:MAG: hydroxymethylbilane synthase, partial [Candidatus Anammoxibacter sp.]